MNSRYSEYEKAVSYIGSIPRFTDDDRFIQAGGFYRFLTDALTDMTDVSYQSYTESVRVFHVAGTNGKGSVCAYLASVHRALGKSVGVFTSPHLTDIRERIRYNDDMISEEDFAKCHVIVMDALRRYNEGYGATATGISRPYTPVYFDHLFFIAVVYYMKKRPDCVIWEVGLGGRLDATNVIPYKSVSVITSIGMDHTDILGDTIEAIACEKAGIIVDDTPVITVDKHNEALGVISREAARHHAPLTVVPDYRDIKKKMSHKGIDFSYESHYYNNAILGLVAEGVCAPYQTENASLAVAALESVYDKGALPLEAIRRGLMAMHWSGRMERIEEGIYFDGAHNTDGIEAFLECVRTDGCIGKRLLLFSAVADKQAEELLGMILGAGLFDMIGLGAIDSDRSIDGSRIVGLKAMADRACVRAEIYGDARMAYDELKELRGTGDILYVCGSLYLVGELKRYTEDRMI